MILLVEYNNSHLQLETEPSKSLVTKYRTRSSNQYKEMKSFYSETNDSMMKTINKTPEQKDQFYSKAMIPDILVDKSRAFRSGGCPESEYEKSFGKHLDKPMDKFFKTFKLPSGKEKIYYDCLNISKGTNKASYNIQGYSGN